MRRIRLTLACSLAGLSCACVAVVIESNSDDVGSNTESSDSAESSTSVGPGDGDGDPGDGDGDGGPGDGDGDGGPGDGDGDGDPTRFRVVVMADLHVPGPGSTNKEEYVQFAHDRLLETRDKIAAMIPPPAFVVVIGDMVHDAYPSSELIWYQTNDNAFADVVEILDTLDMPVYPVFGDSDYDVPNNTRQLSHLLFANFFASDPYTSLDHLGWRFVFANSQAGQTFESGTLAYDTNLGSFGDSELGWLGDQLGAGMPSVLFSHFPLFSVASNETQNGAYADIDAVLAAHGDNVELILSGHAHQWSELPANFAAPHYVFGATSLDSDNFLVIEFWTNTTQYEILDLGKVKWGSSEADTWVYDGTPMPMP